MQVSSYSVKRKVKRKEKERKRKEKERKSKEVALHRINEVASLSVCFDLLNYSMDFTYFNAVC